MARVAEGMVAAAVGEGGARVLAVAQGRGERAAVAKVAGVVAAAAVGEGAARVAAA